MILRQSSVKVVTSWSLVRSRDDKAWIVGGKIPQHPKRVSSSRLAINLVEQLEGRPKGWENRRLNLEASIIN